MQKTYSRSVTEYYQKGVTALDKKNYEYAIEMLLQVVQLEPHYGEARSDLYRALREKSISQPASIISKIFIKGNVFIPLLLASFYEMRKDYEKALAFYDDLLRLEPSNPSYLKKIHALSIKNQWTDIATIALEAWFAYEPSNASLAKQLGDLYCQKQDVDRAGMYYKKALEIMPHDQHLSKALKDLEAMTTIRKGGWDQKGSYRDKIKNEDESLALEHAQSLAGDRRCLAQRIQSLEQSLQEKKTHIPLWLSLIDTYQEAGDLQGMQHAIERALVQCPGDEAITQRKRGLEKLVLLEKKKKLESELEKAPTNTDVQKSLDALCREIESADQALLEDKVLRYPNDLSLKYELGIVYEKNTLYDKAIAEFQNALKDPSLSIRALHHMGLCFHKKKMYDLAVLQFSKALEKNVSMNELGKEITYDYGVTLEAMQKAAEAIEQFKRIYEIDISYKDIAHKIETYYKK